MAYKTLLNGCGVDIFQPFYKIFEHKKKLHKVSIDVGLVELDKFKKEDKEAIGPKDKVSVPYLCVNNLPESVLSILLQSDRDGTYHRHDYQKSDSYEVLWAGDMGANSTKFGFFNTREQKINSGQKLQICLNVVLLFV